MSNWSGYDNSCIGSIYLAVYELVAATPAVAACKDRIIRDLDEARISSFKVHPSRDQNHWETKPTFLFKVTVGGKEVDYGSSSRELNREMPFEIGHLLSENECDEIYFNHVGEGKLFRPHGLMNNNTVRNGTKGDKNQFSLWLKNKVLRSSEVQVAFDVARSRLYREAHVWLQDPERNQKYLEMMYIIGKKKIVETLQKYKHLPDFVLKEAFQMFLVSDIMDLDE